MKSVCDAIEEKCRKYPDLKYERKNNALTVFPSNQSGFSVSYEFQNDRHVVYFDGWHENFVKPEDALNCFGFGLSKKCRLQVHRKGNFAFKWIVESQNDQGLWSEDSTTGLLIFPFWKKTEITFLQNEIIA